LFWKPLITVRDGRGQEVRRIVFIPGGLSCKNMGEEKQAHRALAGAAPFLFLLGLIAILARAQAIVTAGPWYGDSTSTAIYALTLGVAAVLTIAGTVVGIQRTWKLDDKVELFDLRLALVRSGLREGSAVSSPRRATDSAISVGPRRSGMRMRMAGESREGPSFDEASTAEDDSSDSPIMVSIDRDDALGLYPFPNGHMRERRSFSSLEAEERELAAARDATLVARDAIWPTLTGPILLSIGFAAIGGTMLPGAGPFLTTNFRLNTLLVLFLAYGWWLLIGWYGFAIASLRRVGRRKRSSSET
jgi:hypothetical protein